MGTETLKGERVSMAKPILVLENGICQGIIKDKIIFSKRPIPNADYNALKKLPSTGKEKEKLDGQSI